MRTLREQPEASLKVDEAESKWPRAKEAWEAVTWAIAHDPHIGKPITESGNVRLVVLEGARSIGLPTVSVVYETHSDDITVHDAEFTEPRSGQAGHA